MGCPMSGNCGCIGCVLEGYNDVVYCCLGYGDSDDESRACDDVSCSPDKADHCPDGASFAVDSTSKDKGCVYHWDVGCLD